MLESNNVVVIRAMAAEILIVVEAAEEACF